MIGRRSYPGLVRSAGTTLDHLKLPPRIDAYNLSTGYLPTTDMTNDAPQERPPGCCRATLWWVTWLMPRLAGKHCRFRV